MGKVLPGKYGKNYYYSYKDENGKTVGLPITYWTYKDYYEPGYLTNDMIDAMIAGKTITFEVPAKNGTKKTISAHLKPYVAKRGTSTYIIEFISKEDSDDVKLIEKNADKIVTSYYEPSAKWGFDFTKPQAIVNSLGLANAWKTWADKSLHYNDIDNDIHENAVQCFTIDVYQVNNSKNKIKLYGKVYKNQVTVLTEEQYKAEDKKAQAYVDAKNAKRDAEATARARVRKDVEAAEKICADWANDIYERLAGKKGFEFITEALSITNNAPVDESLYTKIINTYYLQSLKRFVFDSHKYTDSPLYTRYITYEKYDQAAIDEYKKAIINRLAAYTEFIDFKNIRQRIYDDIQQNGLDFVTDFIDINVALDIGKFKEVKKILLKYKDDPVKAICFNMYKEIFDKAELQDRILNLIKIYHEFYDFPEKDRKALAKFIAVHKLSDYYDAISQYDDVLDTLIDTSKDPKLLKPLLGSIAGTPRANVLKDKTFYFELNTTLRDDILVRLQKPVELLDRLRDLIKEYNVGSNVCIISNIELNPDDSFTFCFYTYSDDTNGEDFDGRRVQYLTRIYNQHYPNEKIYFNYDN